MTMDPDLAIFILHKECVREATKGYFRYKDRECAVWMLIRTWFSDYGNVSNHDVAAFKHLSKNWTQQRIVINRL